jgi:hypothetical protein
VFPPSPDAKNPFFSVTLQPFAFPPAFPFKNTWLGQYYTTLKLPPLQSAILASSDSWVEEDEQAEAIFAVGTDEWCESQVLIETSKTRGCWVTLHPPEADDVVEAQRWWPQGSTWKPWAVGVWMEEADMLVKEGKKWK